MQADTFCSKLSSSKVVVKVRARMVQLTLAVQNKCFRQRRIAPGGVWCGRAGIYTHLLPLRRNGYGEDMYKANESSSNTLTCSSFQMLVGHSLRCSVKFTVHSCSKCLSDTSAISGAGVVMSNTNGEHEMA